MAHMRMNSSLSWRTPAGFALVLTALFFFSSSSAFSQTQQPATQTPEVEQLKKRLQQLEQTVVELKGQIDAIEAKKQTSAPAVVEATYSEPATPADTPSTAPAKPQNNQGESTFQVYGFAMFDAAYKLKQNNRNWLNLIRPSNLPRFPKEFAQM